MTKELAPIILFVYNRPDHTRQTVEALQKNEFAEDSVLYVFSDGPKENATQEQLEKIQEVRKYIHSINGFKSIHIEESENNKGLANSVIYGVSKVIKQYGSVIVLEDDLITHPKFLSFMNDGLVAYEKDMRIFNVGGTNYNIKPPKSYKDSVYIVHRSESCGWGTWKDRWDNIDWNIEDYNSFCKDRKAIRLFNRGGDDMFRILQLQMKGEVDSWAIRWDYHMYKNNAYCVRPWRSCVSNIGFDGTGIHSGTMDVSDYNSNFVTSKDFLYSFPNGIKPNRKVEKIFHDYWGNDPRNTLILDIRKLLKKIKRLVKRIVLSPLNCR